MDRNRVVITGLGAVSVYGVSVPKFWEGLISGKSGIRRITQFDPADLPCQIAGEIPDFNPADFIERKEARRMPRCAQIAVASAKEAVRDAGLPEMMPDPERAGVVYGTAIGGLDKLDEGVSTLRLDGYSKVNPFIIPAGIPNFPAFAGRADVSVSWSKFNPNDCLCNRHSGNRRRDRINPQGRCRYRPHRRHGSADPGLFDCWFLRDASPSR